MKIVRNWMSTPAITISETTMLRDARKLMRQRNIRRLPIIDSAGRLSGIVSEGDINRVSDSHETDMRDYDLYHHAGDLPVAEIMTRTVIAVSPETPVAEVARRLLENRIGGVPVVDESGVVGVITESDLFRLIVSEYMN